MSMVNLYVVIVAEIVIDEDRIEDREWLTELIEITRAHVLEVKKKKKIRR